MYEVKQPEVARALDVLRGAPMSAAQFALRMWPERWAGKLPGKQSQAGHGLLRRLGQFGYVEKVGDLWMLRRVGTADYSGQTADGQGLGLPVGPPVGQGVGQPVGQAVGPGVGQADRQAEQLRLRQVEQQRLQQLVQLADATVASVTHDRALGDIAIRGAPLNLALAEACAFVVLRGRSANVYPPCGAPRMLVGLTPVEAARALYLRWQQSGAPPESPREDYWIFLDDGLAACPTAWKPAGADEQWVEREGLVERLQRQRVAAGLA